MFHAEDRLDRRWYHGKGHGPQSDEGRISAPYLCPPPEKVADVVSEGAVFHDSIADCVKASDVVITMVGFPKDVEEVYFTPGAILDNAAKDTLLIDMTTTSPTLAKRIAEEGAQRGLRVLDAPVTGGDTGAKAGTLSILVGGQRADFDTALPIFQAMGKTITYFGPAAAASTPKWPIKS